MVGYLRRTVQRSFNRFVETRLPNQKSITLNQSRIFIVPTRQGLMLLVVALIVLIMAINFDSALNYALAFWLISMLWVAVHQTYRNLSGLRISEKGGNLVGVGDLAEAYLQLSSKPGRNRGAIELIHEQWGSVLADVSSGSADVSLPLFAAQRGPIALPRFRIESRYPFNLVVAWSQLKIDAHAWAYPQAIQLPRKLAGQGREEDEQSDDHFFRAGNEDFHSLKTYVPGDPVHRLHWPGFSRDQLLVKSFSDYQSADESVDWTQFPGFTDEQRLAAMAYYCDRYHDAQVPFALRLPDVEVPVGKGPEHLTRVRRALAEYGYEHS